MTGERKTLRQMAIEASGGGMACPNCGCRDTRVVKTRHNSDGSETSRRRVCRHCGNKITTIEMPV